MVLKMGIRLFKNLFTGPATRLKMREPFEKQRGHIDIDIEKCIFCGRCSRECPSGCIKVDRKAATWELNPFECIICGVCVDVCPTKALSMLKEFRDPSDKKSLKGYKGTPPTRPTKGSNSDDAEKSVKSPEKKASDGKKNEVA